MRVIDGRWHRVSIGDYGDGEKYLRFVRETPEMDGIEDDLDVEVKVGDVLALLRESARAISDEVQPPTWSDEGEVPF